MSKKGYHTKGGDDMAVVWEKVYSRTQMVVENAQESCIGDIPYVDPDASGLDDLFAFGDAVSKRRRFKPVESKVLLALVRKHASSN